jgi:hypothetical protein
MSPSLHDARIDAGHLFDDVLELEVGAQRAFPSRAGGHGGVAQHALGVAQRAHHQAGVEFAGRHDGQLDVLVHRRLLRGDEARAHVHAFGAQRQRRHQRAAVGHAARGDEGNLQLLGRARQQDEVGHIVLARVAAALEAVDADRVAADRLGLERVAHRGALVDHLDAGLVQHRHPLLRVVAGGLHGLHAAVDDRLDVAGVVGRADRGQEGQVHAEGLVGHLAAAADLVGQQFRRALREAGDQTQAAGIRHGSGEFGEADKVHAALDDGMLDAEHLGDGLHGGAVLSGWVGLWLVEESVSLQPRCRP